MRTSTLAIAAVLFVSAAPGSAQELARLDPTRALRSEIRAGQPEAGRLEATDSVMEDGTSYDAWTYRGKRGDRIAVTMRSAEFDTYLMLLREDGGELTRISEDDDGAGGTDSRIAIELPEDGEYVVYANALFEDGFGNYTLTVELGAEVATEIANVLGAAEDYPLLRIGDSVHGELTADHPLLEDQSPYQAWSYDGRAGEVVDIEMIAPDFDAYLQVGHAGGLEALEVDDDGGEGTNAILSFEVPEDGRYVVIANSFESAAQGAFMIRVSRGRATVSRDDMFDEVLRGGLTIRKSEPVTGVLDELSPLKEDRSFFQLYAYDGRAGERISVTLRSDDFDAHLGIGRGGSESERVWLQDDDSGGGTDSRITYELPADGVYGIVASTLFPRTSGSYTLEVEDASGDIAIVTPDVIFSPAMSAAAHPVAAGQTVTGALDASSPLLEDGSPFQLWRYRARAGERVTITLRSDDFDTYLQIGFANAPSTRQSDDDGMAVSTDSQLTTTLDRDGDLIIVANSFDGGAGGTYTLTVERH